MAEQDIINVPYLTRGEVEGTGVFDEIMRTVKANLEQEYSKGRISGNNYSEVYLGSLTQVLQTSAQYALEAPLASQKILLLQEEITQAEQNTALILAKIENLKADTAIKVRQLDIMDEQLLDMQAERALTVSKTNESIQQVQQIIAQTALIKMQTDKVKVDIDMGIQQIATEVHNTATAKEKTLLTTAQTALTSQKQKTEWSQISDAPLKGDTEGGYMIVTENIDPNHPEFELPPTIVGGGVLGSTIALHSKQKEGFDHDARQKFASLMVNNWNVRQTTAGGQDPVVAGMSNYDIDNTLVKVKKTLGIVEGRTPPGWTEPEEPEPTSAGAPSTTSAIQEALKLREKKDSQ